MNPTRIDNSSDSVDAVPGKGVMFVAEGLTFSVGCTPFRTWDVGSSGMEGATLTAGGFLKSPGLEPPELGRPPLEPGAGKAPRGEAAPGAAAPGVVALGAVGIGEVAPGEPAPGMATPEEPVPGMAAPGEPAP